MTPTHPQIKGDARCALQHCWYMLLDITLAGGVLNNWNSTYNRPPQPRFLYGMQCLIPFFNVVDKVLNKLYMDKVNLGVASVNGPKVMCYVGGAIPLRFFDVCFPSLVVPLMPFSLA